jgi:hypothetical protein
MDKIPQELIDEMPTTVDATEDSCQDACDATLLVLFIAGTRPLPPILSQNNIEVYPLPPPYYDGEEDQATLLSNLNGGEASGGYKNREIGLLEHCVKNANEYNDAVDSNDLPLANKIKAQMTEDSAHVWNWCNALAKTVCEENVYRPLLLSDSTKEAYVGEDSEE